MNLPKLSTGVERAVGVTRKVFVRGVVAAQFARTTWSAFERHQNPPPELECGECHHDPTSSCPSGTQICYFGTRKFWQCCELPPPLPDLVPVDPGPISGSWNFCYRPHNAEQLVVIVKNQGDAPAPSSTTRVSFAGNNRWIYQDRYTPPLEPGQDSQLVYNIPRECYYNIDCIFRITADAGNNVIESLEYNNTASGRCLG